MDKKKTILLNFSWKVINQKAKNKYKKEPNNIFI